MDHWTEIRTAYTVARTGTVSTAAQELGVHRATVNRHIDALEAEIGVRLFLRHRRGYELTDTGREFLQIAQRSYDLLEGFFGRMRVQSANLQGEVVVATLFPLTDLIMPAILEFRRRHPHTRVRVTTGDELARLELAEAHVALRVGAKATQADYVVQPFCTLEFALFAHQRYVDRYGMPDPQDLTGHLFVGNPSADSPAPFEVWLARNVDRERLVLASHNPKVIEDAVRAGEGIGFLPTAYAGTLPGLQQVAPALPQWQVESWLVTHVDVHRTDKVQSMLACLKTVVGGA